MFHDITKSIEDKTTGVIVAKISDHQPVIHDGVLFWNIMMQAKQRVSNGQVSFNNGFGLVENDRDYQDRLVKVAEVIASIVADNDDIKTIGLCEGPIQDAHVRTFISALQKFPGMKRFFKNDAVYTTSDAHAQQWGLMMLTETTTTVTNIPWEAFTENPSIINKLANRLQLWKLSTPKNDKYFALAHFPFAGNVRVTDKQHLSADGIAYTQLITTMLNGFSNESLIFCADFNFNPYLIAEWEARIADKIVNNNSILLTSSQNLPAEVESVTVDGILLSMKEKQRVGVSLFNHGLYGMLMREHGIFKINVARVECNETQEPVGAMRDSL